MSNAAAGTSRLRADVLLIVGFFAILAYPSRILLQGPEAAEAQARVENRRLAPRPPIDRLFREPSRFVAEFKAFFEDSFSGRGDLVAMNSRLRMEAFGVAANQKVVIGKHKVLFYAGEPVVPTYDLGHEIAKHRRVQTASPARLEQIHEYLLARKRWAEEMGSRFIFVVAPDKSTVYPEYTPDWMEPIDDARPVTDQVLSYLAAKGDVDVVDLRPTMLAAKRSGSPLYYRDDTHWNQLGAAFGSFEVARRLSDAFPAVHPLGPDDLATTPLRMAGDLIKMLHLDDVKERTVRVKLKAPRARAVPFAYDATPVSTWVEPPLAYQIDDPSLPSALIYHDSFGKPMQPFLAEYFRTSVFIRDLHVVRRTVQGYRPDVVVQETVERNLYYLYLNPDDLAPPLRPELLAEDLESGSRGRRR